MIELTDYAGNVLNCNNDCLGCGFANHEFVLPCGMAYEDDVCTVSQDWQLPINGMIIVAPKRHIESFDELTSVERAHLFNVVNAVILVMKKHDIAKYFNVIFEEKKNRHFHIWILPRDGWKELNIDPTKNIDKLQNYALVNLITTKNLKSIIETNKLINSYIKKFL